MMKVAKAAVFITITLISLLPIATFQTNMKGNIIDLLNFIYYSGSYDDRGTGIAVFPASNYGYSSPLDECLNTYPKGEPLAWMLPLEKGVSEFKYIKDSMYATFKHRKTIKQQRWCNLYKQRNFLMNSRDKPFDEVDDVPVIVNGFLITGIEASSDEKEYNVTYKDYAGNEIGTLVHRVENERIVSPRKGVLFKNLTLLREVNLNWRAYRDGPLLINYSPRVGVYYTTIAGIPMHKAYLEEHYSVVLCRFEMDQDLCKQQRRLTIQEELTEYCVECKEHLYGRHCQFDPNECSDAVHEFGFHYVDCEKYKDGEPVVYTQAIVVMPLQHNCSEHATCMNTFGSYMCFCEDGWQGEFCENDVDECEENLATCNKHTSSCENTIGSYKCSCNDGFTGKNCEFRADNSGSQVNTLQWIALDAISLLMYQTLFPWY